VAEGTSSTAPDQGSESPTPTRALQAVSDALVGAATDLSLEAVLERLVNAARDMVGARYAALGVPDGDGGFAHFITTGMDRALVESLGPLPRSHGMLDAMLHQTVPYRTTDITGDPRFRGWWPPTHPRMRSFLGYPIVFKGDVIGAFYLTDKIGSANFDETDEHLVGVFAPHAAVLVEYARLYEQSRELSIADERSRMARELHDALTQTLFGARLAIQTASLALTTPDAPADPAAAVEHLSRAEALVDEAFRELRALILDLRPPDLATDHLAGAVRKQVALLERTSGLTIKLDIDGEPQLPDPDRERQVFRIVQEALANVVRHAGASSLGVSLSARQGSLRIEVQDDGVGFDPDERAIRSRRLGLTSMLDRATALGGRLTIESAPGAGTTVRAEVPLG
jgi:signal transduction histidine kinase